MISSRRPTCLRAISVASSADHFIGGRSPILYRAVSSKGERLTGLDVETFLEEKVADLESAIARIGAEKIAAFIAEPIQASGGVIIPPDGYHRRCLEICRRHDIL